MIDDLNMDIRNNASPKAEPKEVSDQSDYVCTCGQEWDNHDYEKCVKGLCGKKDKTRVYEPYAPKSDGLEEVVDRVKIEGMLHILPDDKDRLLSAIRKYIKEIVNKLMKHKGKVIFSCEIKTGVRRCFINGNEVDEGSWQELHQADCREEIEILYYNSALSDLLTRLGIEGDKC